MKPNLVIIGSQKCGTSSLHNYLDLHPDISMSRQKELDFFVETINWPKGTNWYESQFTGDTLIHGESSPSYTMFPNFTGIPERMHAILPNIRLIYIVRDPIDRIISHYLHQWYQKRQDSDFDNVLHDLTDKRTQHYINTSKYYMQLSQYLKYYDLSNIYIISLEELQTERDSVLKNVYNFLSVEHDYTIPTDIEVFNKTQSKLRTNKLGDFVLSSNILSKTLRNALKDAFPTAIKNKLKGYMGSRQKKPAINPYVFNMLKDTLYNDIQNFKQVTGKEFPSWQI